MKDTENANNYDTDENTLNLGGRKLNIATVPKLGLPKKLGKFQNSSYKNIINLPKEQRNAIFDVLTFKNLKSKCTIFEFGRRMKFCRQ